MFTKAIPHRPALKQNWRLNKCYFSDFGGKHHPVQDNYIKKTIPKFKTYGCF